MINAICERYEIDPDAPWDELSEDAQNLFLYGTHGERVYVQYRNRMGRKRSYMLAFEGIVPSLQRRYKDTDSAHAARADRGVHVVPAVPGLQGRAPQAGGARGHDRREVDQPVHAAVGDARARVPRRARPDRDRAADRAPDHQGDPRAAELPRQRRRRLPAARPRVGDALGRRGAAAAAGDADRLAARRRALHPRRAVDRAPPARQRPADRDADAASRPRQHGARRRARRADDAQRRLARRHGAGRGRARRPRRRGGHCVEGRAREGLGHRPVPLREALDRGARAARPGPRLLQGVRRDAAQPEGHRRRLPGRQLHLRHGRLRLRQVDARERDRLQGAREPAEPDAREARRARRASRGSTSSTR